MGRIVSSAFLVLLLTGMFMLAFNVRLVHAQVETVTVNGDGSVSPSNAPISSIDNVTYTFTGNMRYPAYDGIVIERSNIVIDGEGYTVQGDQSGDGISMTSISNVTIKNANIEGFENGIHLIDSNNGVISGNNITANSSDGIFVDGSSNNTVSGNNATANGAAGIYLYSSSNYDAVSGNNITANVYGIDVAHCSDNTVSANNATANSEVGIDLFGSTETTVSRNYARTNGDGIWLDLSASNVVSGNNAMANTVGIYLYDSADNNVSGNDATANGEGIYLSDSVENAVSGNNATTNIDGIYLSDSSFGNTVSENTATANSADGIYLEGSSSNVVSGNNAEANVNGIYLNSSSSNIISGNNASANSDIGIYLNFSSNNAVIGNNVTTNGDYGIYLSGSSNSNTVTGDEAAANVVGIEIDSSSNNIVSDNSATASLFGQGIVVNDSSNNTVSGNSATGNHGDGIDLNSCNCTTVSGNNVTNNGGGIGLYLSSNITVSGNVCAGISLGISNNNTVSSNIVTNGSVGIDLESSSNNTVSGNYVAANSRYGILLSDSSGNIIYHNSFVGNSVQAFVGYVSPSEPTNTWDDGYPSGGNFWSDYNGTDSYSGPYQNVTGSDGIGDTPYVIVSLDTTTYLTSNTTDIDHFPLMGPFSDFSVAAGVNVQVVSNSTVSDFQFNGTAILFNVSGANGSTGFCNVRLPTELLNGTLSVFVNGTRVKYSLLPSSNSSISYLYFTYGHSTEQVIILPEFPEPLIMAMLMLATLPAIAIHKKKHNRS
jgi:parallel beta-helix repeat protein